MSEQRESGGRAPGLDVPKAKVIAILVLVGLVGVIALRVVMHKPEKKDPDSERQLVSVITPVPGDIPATVAITGAISARNDMPIGPEGEGGRVAAVHVEAGCVRQLSDAGEIDMRGEIGFTGRVDGVDLLVVL